MVPQPLAASIMRSASTTFVVIGFSMKVAMPARMYGNATPACFSLCVAIRTPSNLAGASCPFPMTVTETPGKDSKVRSIFRPHPPCPTRPSRRFILLFARLKAISTGDKWSYDRPLYLLPNIALLVARPCDESSKADLQINLRCVPQILGCLREVRTPALWLTTGVGVGIRDMLDR